MQVSLVKPTLGRRPDGPFVDEARMEPLNLGVLAGLTPPGVDVRLWDDRVDAIDYDEPTDLVAITVETFTARRAYEIADEYRARRVPVVMGGMHATALPDEVAEHADAVYTGDAETRWAEVVADAHDGRLRPRYDAPDRAAAAGQPATPRPLRGQGLPADLAAPVRARLPASAASTARWAPTSTTATTSGPSTRWWPRSSPSERRDLFFVDDNLIADHAGGQGAPPGPHPAARALGVAGERRPGARPGADGAHGRERLPGQRHRLREPRPGQPARRCASSPTWPASTATSAPCRRLRDHHLQTWAAFLLGYDHDTPASIVAQCDWAIEQHFTFAAFNVLMPYPGTPLYERLAAEGRLLYDGRWWLHPDYRFNSAAFRPARHDRRRADRGRLALPTALEQPRLDRPARPRPGHQHELADALRPLLLYNPLFRRESFKRQGLLLGLR